MTYTLRTFGDGVLGSYDTLDEAYRAIIDRRIKHWRIFRGAQFVMYSQHVEAAA